MKDLFSGSLGRLNNHGGSRMFTTPNTVYVPPDYQIETDVPSIAEFVTCSLDGRLWVFRRSRRYYVAVLKWDAETQRLVFVSTTAISNTNIIGRGIDWILTDTMIIQVSDNEPYIFIANLFADNETSFMYSVLRSSVMSENAIVRTSYFNGASDTNPHLYSMVGPGYDTFTKTTWGQSEDNGNPEGYGIFNRSALLQSVNKHYSMLPSIGNWNIIKNFLIRRADNPLSDVHNSMLNIRPLIPLEFHVQRSRKTSVSGVIYYHYPTYGAGFNNDINITYFNGELWARGLYNIGKCYILPAVFDESGNPQEFYLYISPDYKKSNGITQADWLNLGVLHTDETVYGFLCEQTDNFDNSLCYSSETPKLLLPSTSEWQELSENGQMFIDTLNHSGLVLHDNGAILINGNSYECKGLQQWLAPAGIIEAVSEQSIISSFDNAVVATYPQQGFYRELLAGKKLPISAKSFSGKRLSLDETDKNNNKVIQVNKMTGVDNIEATWENTYKPAINVQLIHSSNSFWIYKLFDITQPLFLKRLKNTITYSRMYHPDEIYTLNSNSIYTEFGVGMGITVYSQTINATFFYIGAENGRLYEFDVTITLPQSCHFDTDDYGNEACLQDILSQPGYFFIEDGVLKFYYSEAAIKWWRVEGYFEETYHEWGSWHPEDPHGGDVIYTNHEIICCSLPSDITDWSEAGDWITDKAWINLNNFYLGDTNFNNAIKNSNIIIQNLANSRENISACLVAEFREGQSNTIFLYNLPSVLTIKENKKPSGVLANWETINSIQYALYANTTGTEFLHFALFSDGNSKNYLLVFKSKLHPEIFDFASEVERSKFS